MYMSTFVDRTGCPPNSEKAPKKTHDKRDIDAYLFQFKCLKDRTWPVLTTPEKDKQRTKVKLNGSYVLFFQFNIFGT